MSTVSSLADVTGCVAVAEGKTDGTVGTKALGVVSFLAASLLFCGLNVHTLLLLLRQIINIKLSFEVRQKVLLITDTQFVSI